MTKRARLPARFKGLPVCSGIGIGPIGLVVDHALQTPVPRQRTTTLAAEEARLAEAVGRSLRQIDKLRARLALLPEDSQAEIAPLIDAYRQMLGPSRLLRGARARLAAEAVTAEAAIADEADMLAARLREAGAGLDAGDATAGRQADEVQEIARRLIRNLSQAPFRSFKGLAEGAVLVAEQLRPADAALIDPSRIAAVAVDEGGASDHTAIMLRALGIPAVLGASGVSDAAREAPPGAQIIVDGAAGVVLVAADEDALAEARVGVASYARERQRLARLRRLPAVLESGEPVELQANLELPAELPLIAQSGAAGIGLLRTEFLFINAETLPDFETQRAIYREVVEAMGGDCTTIRVLDWGGEKQSDALAAAGFLSGMGDANPALGLRGLRLLLRHPSVFETQLAAILDASRHGPVRVMLPMVTTAGELRAAREIYERVGRRLRRKGIRLPEKMPPLGVMIETPSAALGADALALEADFLAIGTNDLTMYTLAVDRGAAEVASLYDPLHPTVLQLIAQATEAALRLRRPVSICGELAGNPKVAPLLLGMGLRSFSMNASAVPLVKQAVRAADLDRCVRFARRVAEQAEPEGVARLLAEFEAGS